MELGKNIRVYSDKNSKSIKKFKNNIKFKKYGKIVNFLLKYLIEIIAKKKLC